MKKKKVLKIFLIIFVAILVIMGVFLIIMGRPITKIEAEKQIQSIIDKSVDNEHISGAVFTIESKGKGISQTFFAGTKGKNQVPINSQSQFHAASVGKTFTVTIIGILENRGVLSYSDKIKTILDEKTLQGLFVYEETDYSHIVTIEQLLSNTSGAADYFEGPVTKGKPIIEMLETDPNYLWTPQALVNFTRENQQAVGKPGEQMHYSDTGYILLGFIIEAVTGKTYDQVLTESIVKPLKLTNTYLLYNSRKNEVSDGEIMDLNLNGINLVGTNALSIDWTGGGIVTTTDDLLTFYKALNEGDLVQKHTLEKMTDFQHKYLKGVYYGSGMMQFRFRDFSPLLSGMSNIHGGVGASSSFMLYDSNNDTYIIGNSGSLDIMGKSVQQLINILLILSRIEN